MKQSKKKTRCMIETMKRRRRVLMHIKCVPFNLRTLKMQIQHRNKLFVLKVSYFRIVLWFFSSSFKTIKSHSRLFCANTSVLARRGEVNLLER